MVKDKICACGCGKYITSGREKTLFLSGHQNRNKFQTLIKETDIIICACGCEKQIIWKKRYKYEGWPKYINFHLNNVRKGKKLEEINKIEKVERHTEMQRIRENNININPNDIIICACGCGERIEYLDSYKNHGWPKYKYQNHMKIPKHELYGSLQKLSEINKKLSLSQKGKKKPEGFGEEISKRQQGVSMEERCGKEKTDEMRLKQAMFATQPLEIKWGKERTDKFKIEQRDRLLGKTWYDLYDDETVARMYNNLNVRTQWGEGPHEKRYFDNFDEFNKCLIERHKIIWLKDCESPHFVDGFYDNKYYEFFEPYHRYKQKELDYIKFKKMIEEKKLPIIIIFSSDWNTYYKEAPIKFESYETFEINDIEDLNLFYKEIYT